MFTISCASACVRVGTLLATIAVVTCDYDGNQAASFADRNLDSNVLCNGGRCTETSDGIAGAMWFGPRLGRKRRSDEKMETIDEEIGAIADVINSGPWAWVAYSGGGDKRHTTQFTPRLGRELTDDFLQKYMAYDFDKNRLSRYIAAPEDASLQRHQSPPPPPPQFAPRLGRNLPFNPSPRLGRHLRFVQKV
ncbi:PBAN-type neuropeptides [Diachasma alloeum]|uniref:PBAN-type neuropeptides n=1 Tax=Diachasma alloeum TaxID=454923 RepID=UPI00073835A8|nr:PBAN-type neuropeptides [Diachasma alloeum]